MSNLIDDTPPIAPGTAWIFFAADLNYTRLVVEMSSFVDATVLLDPTILTRFAVLTTMSKNLWLKREEIERLLKKFGYHRSSGSIRQALRKIAKFGFAETRATHNKNNRYGKHEWRMTEAGYQFIQSPMADNKARGKPKKPKVPKQKRLKTGKRNGSQTVASATQGGTTMCIDPSKPILNAAIESIVNDVIAKKDKFSAHDVTKKLRECVAIGNPPFPDIADEAGTVFVQGKELPKIDHDYVRDAVHELFHQGKMTGYERLHTGTHWEYLPVTAQAPDPDPAGSTPTPSGNDYDGNPTL